MAQNHPVNLLNEKDLNQFIADIIYFGEEPDFFETAELRDLSYVKEHKDAVIRAMVYQWVKTRLRTFLITDTEQNQAFLEPLNPWNTSYHKILEQYTPDGHEPIGLRSCYEQGRKVNVFNQEKMPSEIKDEITNLRDFLYDEAGKKVERAITVAEESQQGKNQKGGFRLRLDALKTDNKYKEYEQAKKASEIWHYKLVVQSAKLKNVYRDERGEEELIQFADGMKIVRLLTPEALDYESAKMGHCVGKGGYDKGVTEGRIQIYSLRDKQDNPHVTFEVRGKDIRQCKGKENCHPVRKYAPYCRFFVNHSGLNLCKDMRQLGLISQDGICYDLYDLPENFVIKGNLDLRKMDLNALPDLSHVIVEGNFDCSYNKLTSLSGAPQKVGGNFDCVYNGLTSLSGAPQKVGGNFDCSENRLKNLKGCPKVKGKIKGNGNKIESLEGYYISQDGKWYDICHLPENFVIKGDLKLSAMGLVALSDLSHVVVEGDFDCSENSLKNLKGCPKVKGKIKGNGNKIESLEGYYISQDGKWYDICHLPENFVIKGDLKLSAMGLVALSDLSHVVVEGDFDCSENSLKNLKGCPKVKGKTTASWNDLNSLEGYRICQDGKWYDIYHLPENFVIKGGLDLSRMSLGALPDLSHVVVEGSFNCSFNKLTSLSGAPQKVEGSFNCSFNKLKSLSGAPQKVGENFDCSDNELTSLSGAPQKVEGSFNCSYNRLTSLSGAPQKVGENFNCVYNGLTSLSGAPQEVGGNFDCSWNDFVSLQGAPEQVGGDFKCLDCCSLKSSKGAPRLLGGIFICHDRQFESKPVYENGKLKNSAVVKITSPLSHVR